MGKLREEGDVRPALAPALSPSTTHCTVFFIEGDYTTEHGVHASLCLL